MKASFKVQPVVLRLAGDESESKEDTGENPARSIRFVCCSDTHNLHRRIHPSAIPDGDVFVHCGDFTNRGTLEEAIKLLLNSHLNAALTRTMMRISDFNDWLGTLDHPTKLVVTGNHESGPFTAFDSRRAAELLSNATFVDNSAVVVGGVSFFGVPWKRQFAAGKALRALASAGNAPDVLFCHEPVKGLLDDGKGCATLRELCFGQPVGMGAGAGAEAGAEACVDDPSVAFGPRVLLFGHIHETAGFLRLPAAPRGGGGGLAGQAVEAISGTAAGAAGRGEGVLVINCAVAGDGMRTKAITRPFYCVDIAPRAAAAAGHSPAA